MKYRFLNDDKVSAICLGTMTWGEQNSQEDAHQQLDYALEQGINFIDTAELYPVPPRKETYGLTEKYIGTYFKKNKKREKVILASKIIGPVNTAPRDISYIRNPADFSEKNIELALDQSLKRLQTDYIDLYQLHWPERQVNNFGKLNYVHKEETFTSFIEILKSLEKFIKKGKIRMIGISNETAWGMSKFLHLAEIYKLPKMISIQNVYNLLNRSFEVSMAEIAIREKCGLLAYSPLAFGALSGKYLDSQLPTNSRLSLFPQMSRYSSEQANKAIDCYVKLAKEYNITPSQLAIAWILKQKFTTSVIIGATQIKQLKENISAVNIDINAQLEEKINQINNIFSNICP